MTYGIAYTLAWINAAVGIISGVLSAANLTVHPSWLTSDVALTCGLCVPITVGLAAFLPSVKRTPRSRETKYLVARQGLLPADLEAKHGPLRKEPPKPFDTYHPDEERGAGR